MTYFGEDKTAVFLRLSKNGGLSLKEVEISREKYGRNELKKPPKKSFVKRLFSTLSEPMMLILLVSACITFGVNVGRLIKTGSADFTEGLGVLASVALSVCITMVMEGSSARAFSKLESLYDKTPVRVYRENRPTTLKKEELVVGDVVLLESGDKVVADGRLLSADGLFIDESAFTGESRLAEKDADAVLPDSTPLAERKNSVYSGSFVAAGSGTYVVTAVGDKTEIGDVATAVGEENKVASPLEQKLGALGKKISVVGTAVAALVFVLTVVRLVLQKNVTFDSVQDAFLTGMILVVAAVPEGLPTIVAISLALNMIRLAKERALIKKMVATETTGAVSVICTDKTGTLTENKMRVERICTSGYCAEPESVKTEVLYQNFVLNSTAELGENGKKESAMGAPEETALLAVYRRVFREDYRAVRERCPVVSRLPFSSEEKKMETCVKTADGYRKYVKGAPEVILPFCTLEKAEKKSALKNLEDAERQAKRALCFAHADGDTPDLSDAPLHFDGFALLWDGVRHGVKNAVLKAKEAGIDVKMLTGDNRLTAFAVGVQTGICRFESETLTAADVEKMTDEELKNRLPSVKVIARSTPKTKLRVVNLLKENGEVVAVTGDGINDAPAIRHADVGIAMGVAGSEITKEAADVVLLDDSFPTIVKAVAFGRNVYQNLQRFILFQLSVNVSALLVVVACFLLGLPSPFTTLELLWINVIMDGPPAITLGLERVNPNVLKDKPVKRDRSIVTKTMLLRILLTGLFTATLTVLEYRYDLLSVGEAGKRTAAFTLFVFFQLFNALNARELGFTPLYRNFFKNKAMLFAFGLTMAAHAIIVTFVFPLAGGVSLGVGTWLKLTLLSSSVVALSETSKGAVFVLKKIAPHFKKTGGEIKKKV